MVNRESVTLVCPKCEKPFRVLADEAIKDMECLECGYLSEGGGDMLEHPQIKEMNQKGYLNQASQPEHWGIDVMDHEILTGDEIIELPSGEVLLVDNLEDYLIERCGFRFKQAL